MAPEDDPIYELGSIMAAVRRRIVLVVVPALVAAAAALAISLSQPERFEATSTLLFRAPGLDEQIFDRPVLFGGTDVNDAETNAGLVALDEVAAETEGTSGVEGSAAEIADAVSVGQGAGPGLIEVTAEADDPVESATLANTYADSFIEIRREANRRDVEAASDSVEQELAALPEDLRRTAQADRLREELRELEALNSLQISDAELVGEATPPAEASSPKPLRNAILAGIAGLVLGLAGALLVERLSGYRVSVARGG